MSGYRRGITKIKGLFEEELVQEQKRLGRDMELQAAKEECICYRFYYYRVILKIQFYEVLMEKLSGEFFLSKDTVPRIIDRHTVTIQRIKNEAPTVEVLRTKYRWMVWEGNLVTG